MTHLSGQIGEIRFTLNVKRKDTGKVETYEMVGKVLSDEPVKEDGYGSNTQHSCEERSN